MKKYFFLIILFALTVQTLRASDTIQKRVWVGKLLVNSLELRLVLNVFYLSSDSLRATLDNPDQGVKGIAVDEIRISPDSLGFQIRRLMAIYHGGFNSTKDTLNGIFFQAGMKLPLVLAAQAGEFVLKRPQEPQPPYSYRTEEVTFRNPKASIKLSGTLTMPQVTGKFPAIILVTGSGPQNRNEELMGHKPFLVLADMLTNMGFVVLRYDDRGVGKSEGDFATATTYDFAEDAASALQYLRGRPEVDTSRLGVLGHSEGGIVAEILASEPGVVTFAVLLAGPALKGEEILKMQSKLISRNSGIPEKQIEESQGLSNQIYSVLKKNSDNEKAAQKIRRLMEDYNKKAAGRKDADTLPQAEIDIQVRTLTSAWFRTFLTLDPIEYIRKIKCPILALYGEKDLQVPAPENAQEMEKGLLFAGNDLGSVITIQGVNHLFQTADIGLPSEYGKIEETLSPSMLDTLKDWLMSNIQW
jgi:uncharacterized protein